MWCWKKLFVEAPETGFEAGCGLCLGFLKGVCGVSFSTTQEFEEIWSLKKVKESMLKKSSKIVTLLLHGLIKQGLVVIKIKKVFIKNY